MPELAVVMVGMDGWQEWTKPALDSVLQYLPDANVVVVDHGRDAYPVYKNVKFLRFDQPVSYSHAINAGVAFAGQANWYLIINNDVLVYEPLYTARLDPDFLYAKRILHEQGITWIDSWLVLVSSKVWDLVGGWDEKFLMCGFEDADYCIRAANLGIAIQPLEWEIQHFWGKTRWKLPGYKEQRLKNIDYLERKHGKRLGQDVRVLYG